MKKKFLNECIDCGHIGDTALWRIKGYQGVFHINEMFPVGPEPGNDPEHFDLDTIDAKILIEKYNLTEEKAEEFILNGEPCCPECKSLNYFKY